MGRNLKRIPTQQSIPLEDSELNSLSNIQSQIEQLGLVQSGLIFRLEKKFGVYIPENAYINLQEKTLNWEDTNSNVIEFPPIEKQEETSEGEVPEGEHNDTDQSD